MDLSYVQSILPAIWNGTKYTVMVFFATLIIAFPLGLPFAFGSIAKFKPIRFICKFYIWIFRGTPLMLQLFFFVYFLPILTGIVTSRITTAIVTFGLNYAAYFAEIYRGGIQSIDYGQHEAAKSLGFNRKQTMSMIVLPQAISRIIPPINNELITLIKDTSMVHIIGVPELLKASKDANNRDSNPTGYLVAAIIYLLFTFLLTIFAQKMEVKYSRHIKKDA